MFLRRSPGGVALPPTLAEMVNQACIDLLTLLGIYLDRERSTEAQTGGAQVEPPDEITSPVTGGAAE